MIIEQSAEDYINKTLKDNEILKISVVGGGCNGFSYNFEIFESKCFPNVSGKIYIDSRSAIFLKDCTLVYQTQPFSAKLTIINPNAKNTCGCGESFSL